MTLLPPELCAGHICLVGLQFHSTKVWQERGKLTETETEFVLYRRKNNMLTRKLDKNNWNWNFVLKHVSKIISNMCLNTICLKTSGISTVRIFASLSRFGGTDRPRQRPSIPSQSTPPRLPEDETRKPWCDILYIIHYIYNILYITYIYIFIYLWMQKKHQSRS